MPSFASALSQPTLHGSQSDPKPDYVIVFDTSVKAGPPPKAKGNQTKHEQNKAQDKPDHVKERDDLQTEYTSLLGALEAAGLEATGRSGGKNSGQILIFVRASEERVQAEVHRERLSDWLHGVKSTKPSPRTPRDFSSDPITPAERLRLVHSILTTPRSSTSVSVTSSASSGRTAGITPTPSPASFPHVTSIFPPHDPHFNKTWIDRWNSRSHIGLSIPPEELVEIKDHLGEKVALYFAFLQFYFSMLGFPAALGALFWLLGLHYSPYYSAALCAWSVLFIERWRIKEREIAVEWGTYGAHEVETQRAEFEGSSRIVDPVTGVEKDYFPFGRTLLRQLASVPVLFAFMLALAALISVIYSIETIVGEVYEGPAKRVLTLIPTVLFVGVVPQVTALWQATATRLTSFENHPHQTEHEKSLTLKVFALNFFVAYGSLILTSYVYIPFGSILVPHILSILPSQHAARLCNTPGKLDFSINSYKLHTQIVAYTLTNQMVGAFTEIGVPLITRLVKKEVEHVQEQRSKSRPGSPPAGIDEEDEKVFLERIRLEASLPEYSTFADYAEMATQFGYLTLWTTIWPIAPLWSFVNNFFELRGDAFKITTQHRRPVPVRETTIGPWLEALGFMTWLAAMTNASLVYLYRPHISHPTPTADFLADLAQNVTGTAHNITVPQNTTSTVYTSAMHLASHSTDPMSAIKSTLWRALLVALTTEHAYLAFRGAVRFLLHHLLWRDCQAEQAIRRAALDLRRGYLEEMNLKKGPVDLAEESGATEKAQEKDRLKREIEGQGLRGFWSRGDRGLEAIRRATKDEKGKTD